MATELYVIIDDNGGQFQYAGGEWTLSTLEQWFGATSWYPGFAVDGTEFGSFTFTFEGTSVAFIGNTPDSQAVLFQTATVSIDGGTPYNITYGDVPPPAYRQWYQSPTLADGPHTIRMGHLAMTAVDFALVRVGSQTPLSGKRVFVDNDNAAFKYDGTWSRETGQFNAGSLPDGFPVGNSTHRTSTPGSTMTFRFSGTAASIYGIFDWANIGRLAATYTLDGVTDAQNYVVTAATPQHLNNDGQASNFLLFSYDSLPSGDHTLVINVTNCVSQTFMLDYITYSPSFSSLAAMPNLTATVTPPSSSSLPNPSTSPSSTAPSTSQVSQNEISKKAPVGVIVGGVVGGLVLLALLAFLLIWIRKRRRAKSAQETVQSFPHSGQSVTTSEVHQRSQLSPVPGNFTYSSIPSSGTISPFQHTLLPAHRGVTSAADLKHASDETQRSRYLASPMIAGTPSDTGSSGLSEGGRSTSPSSGSNIYVNSNLTGNINTDQAVEGPPAYDALSTHRVSTRLPTSEKA